MVVCLRARVRARVRVCACVRNLYGLLWWCMCGLTLQDQMGLLLNLLEKDSSDSQGWFPFPGLTA